MQTNIGTNTTNISNLTSTVSNLQLKSLTDVSDSLAPTNGQVLKYDGTSSQWISATDNGIGEAPNDGNAYRRKNLAWEADPIQSGAPIDGLKYARSNAAWTEVKDYRVLSALEDQSIITPSDGQLLTYDNTLQKWTNKVKPTYTIEEQKDYTTGAAKANLDLMSWNASTSKWIPYTPTLEVLNYFTSYCNIAVITQTNVGGFIPVFANTSGYVTNLVGDFATISNSTTLTFARTGVYSINLIAQGSVNQSNPRMYKNGSLLVYGTRTEANNSGGINVILSFNATDFIQFDNDVSTTENYQNLTLSIRELQTNKKIVNQVVQNATLLSQLGDTSITNPSDQQFLTYSSSLQKWQNSSLSLSGQSAEYLVYRTTSGIGTTGAPATELNVTNAIPLFSASVVSGTAVYDTSRATGIVSTINP